MRLSRLFFAPSHFFLQSTTFPHVSRYHRYAVALQSVLVGEFDADVNISFIKDQGATGNFEVVITNTNELIHSKRNGGGGRCESASENQAVIDKIQAFLDKE